jgi:hypothetical protein
VIAGDFDNAAAFERLQHLTHAGRRDNDGTLAIRIATHHGGEAGDLLFEWVAAVAHLALFYEAEPTGNGNELARAVMIRLAELTSGKR